MNYKESIEILGAIKRAKRILINCHRSPDPDSIGSALAMFNVLKKMGKDAEVICPSEELFDNVSYLNGYKMIRKNVDFSRFDFSKYDLFIILDSSSWEMVTNDPKVSKPKSTLVVIDHHETNNGFGDINIVNKHIQSTGEIIFRLFEDWKIQISKTVADCIMAAVIGDTGAFRFPGTTVDTFEIAGKLLKLGADKDKAIHHIYRSEPYELIKFYGEVLTRAKVDRNYKFVWAAIPFAVYSKTGRVVAARESAASLFAQVVEETEFGFIAVEQEPQRLRVSFRSRTGFDTSQIATELGGGGHVYASGASVKGMPFEQAVERVLEVCRKYAKKEGR